MICNLSSVSSVTLTACNWLLNVDHSLSEFSHSGTSQESVVVKNVGSGAEQPGFVCWLHLLPAVWSWTGYLSVSLPSFVK